MLHSDAGREHRHMCGNASSTVHGRDAQVVAGRPGWSVGSVFDECGEIHVQKVPANVAILR